MKYYTLPNMLHFKILRNKLHDIYYSNLYRTYAWENESCTYRYVCLNLFTPPAIHAFSDYANLVQMGLNGLLVHVLKFCYDRFHVTRGLPNVTQQHDYKFLRFNQHTHSSFWLKSCCWSPQQFLVFARSRC